MMPGDLEPSPSQATSARPTSYQDIEKKMEMMRLARQEMKQKLTQPQPDNQILSQSAQRSLMEGASEYSPSKTYSPRPR